MPPLQLDSASIDVLRDRASVPTYDRSKLEIGIVHFGVGGFHRSHQAMYLDRLLTHDEANEWAICGVGVMPADEAMGAALAAQDNLYTLVIKEPGGGGEVRIIGSLVKYLYAPSDPAAVLDMLTREATRIVTLTITEGGYNLDEVRGVFDAENVAIRADLVPGAIPRTVFAYVVEALERRRALSIPPFTIVSCDNIQGNGDVARTAFSSFANLKDPELGAWVRESVAFPSSMVDRITPVTTAEDITELRDRFGIADARPVVCEPFTQWVLEDTFPTGRPPWEHCGVQLTDDVRPYEQMKLRLLNAGHQALAHTGSLVGYTYAHEAAADPLFVNFVRDYMNLEARPTLGDVPGVDLDDYVQALLERFASTAIRDTLARLCAFTSDRIPKFLLPVLRQNLATGGEIARSTTVVASWARYAEGVNELGSPIEIEDRLRDELVERAKQQRVNPLAFVQNEQLFGDLAQQPVFVGCYLHALKSLQTVGVRRTLEAVSRFPPS